MKKKSYKLLKLVHIIFSSAWLGGAIILAIIIITTKTSTASELQLKYSIINRIDYYVVFPGALGCLITGILFTATTKWSLIKNRWITLKFLINIEDILLGSFVIAKLEEKLISTAQSVSEGFILSSEFIKTENLFTSLVLLQTSLIIVVFFISVFKPKLFQRKFIVKSPRILKTT